MLFIHFFFSFHHCKLPASILSYSLYALLSHLDVLLCYIHNPSLWSSSEIQMLSGQGPEEHHSTETLVSSPP